jgi:Mg2+/Co2+ transporter CorB
MLLELFAVVILLLISAFYACAETSLTAVSRARMHHLASEGSSNARHVLALVADREKMIGAILLANTFVNILASAIATSVSLAFSERGVLIATVIMTVAILIFAEVLPKTLGIARTDRMALVLARPTRVTVFLLSPVVATVQWIVWRVLHLFGLRGREIDSDVTAHEEIRGAIEVHHQEGGVEREHQMMLGGILDLAELQVGDVMVHRKSMQVIDGGAPPHEIVDRVLASAHTRFPVFTDTPENIIGILHTKDLLRELMQRRGVLEELDIDSLCSEPWFVPITTTLEEQVKAFRERRAHFALVVDEYGVLQGLVTLEDILEEIFGSIAEEHDQKLPEGIRRQLDDTYIVDGGTPIRELNREVGWNLPDEQATTIAGLVINDAQVIPDVGHQFSFHGFKFEVLRKQRNQITQLRITPPPELAAAFALRAQAKTP